MLDIVCLSLQRKAKQASERDLRYQAIMRNLVRRYVTVQQRRAESGGVTEDDVNEIKQDVSAFRCELVEILRNSGMNTSTASAGAGGAGGKKNRQKERRLMKGFNIGAAGALAPVDEILATLHRDHAHPWLRTSQSSLSDGDGRDGRDAHTVKPGSQKRRWGTLMDAARAARFIGRSRSEDSVCEHAHRTAVSQGGSTRVPPVGPHLPRLVRSGSERDDSGSDEPRADRTTGVARAPRPAPLLPFNALAALKRKRKKFSDSRRAADRSRSDKKVATGSAVDAALVRASSVPARSPPHPGTGACPGRAAGSTEPLLASLEDETRTEQAGPEPAPKPVPQPAPQPPSMPARLPGVTPLHGHAPHHSAGWL